VESELIKTRGSSATPPHGMAVPMGGPPASDQLRSDLVKSNWDGRLGKFHEMRPKQHAEAESVARPRQGSRARTTSSASAWGRRRRPLTSHLTTADELVAGTSSNEILAEGESSASRRGTILRRAR